MNTFITNEFPSSQTSPSFTIHFSDEFIRRFSKNAPPIPPPPQETSTPSMSNEFLSNEYKNRLAEEVRNRQQNKFESKLFEFEEIKKWKSSASSKHTSLPPRKYCKSENDALLNCWKQMNQPVVDCRNEIDAFDECSQINIRKI